MSAARWLAGGALAGVALVLAGCSTNGYCIDCLDGGGGGDGAIVDGPSGGGDSGRADACVITSIEVCNNLDDDCNGVPDDPPVQGAGDPCGIDVGSCRSGTTECIDGELLCGAGAVAAQAEVCNDLDDDCDGVVDDGDPGGGALCGTEVGDCQRGLTACTSGTVLCVGEIGAQPELCDGHDNDCDGAIDNGDPEGGAACGAGMGTCLPGTVHCIGTVLQCVGGDAPSVESCDGADNDCDGLVDEDFALLTDPHNCGTCGNMCSAANGVGGCAGGTCNVAYCLTDYWDLDGLYTTGCEYSCSYLGTEVCDAVDDDCDGAVNEGLTPPAMCSPVGACAGTTATCTGAMGWQCLYPATVSTDATGAIVPETECDNVDNDCDGSVDEPFALKGTPCTNGIGACASSGTYVCNAAGDGVICNAAPPGGGTSESCNGLDDNCNGLIDEGAPDAWVLFTFMGASRWIYKYEASRPDASGATAGTMSHRPCSKASALPWTNITQPAAEAQCLSIGARLCTEAEWQKACETSAAPVCTWSYDTMCTTSQATKCNGNEYDFDPGTPADQDGLKATGALASCYANWGGLVSRIFDMSGNVKEWAVQRSAGVNPLRGGNYASAAGGLTCQFDFVVANDTFQFENVGFRCCRDTTPP